MYKNVQKVSLRVILAGEYENYRSALRLCSLSTLFERREKRVLEFSLRSLEHAQHKNMFPLSEKYTNDMHGLRKQEKFQVNFAAGQKYKSSFVPYAQRKLNQYVSEKIAQPLPVIRQLLLHMHANLLICEL